MTAILCSYHAGTGSMLDEGDVEGCIGCAYDAEETEVFARLEAKEQSGGNGGAVLLELTKALGVLMVGFLLWVVFSAALGL